MGDVYNRGNRTTNLFFYRNLHWNAGLDFPTSTESIIEVRSDSMGIIGDPLLPDLAGLVLPRYNEQEKQFTDGSASIADAFKQLVLQYGFPGKNSPAIDSADPAYAPPEDILGNPRDSRWPDIGAVEFQNLTDIKKTQEKPKVYYDPQRKHIISYSAPTAKMTLYSSQGVLLESAEHPIDLTGYKTGLYIVRGMLSNDQSFTLKFIHR
jgi:hypothetical protein